MKTHHETACPVDRLLRILMGPWTTYILWILHTQGEQRFGALRRAMPDISPKMLTERLRMLEAEGLIHRDYNPTIPPEVTYSLTNKAKELQTILNDINTLAFSWYGESKKTKTVVNTSASII